MSLLDEILSMIHSIKDDPAKLQALRDFMVNEIYEEETYDPMAEVPEKFRPMIPEIAGEIETGMVCYINADTLETVMVPSGVEDEFGDNHWLDAFRDDLKRVEKEWKKVITIEPPDSNEGFRYMEKFVYTVRDERLANALARALNKRGPFRNFKAVIDNSPEREAWFAFKKRCLEEYVADEISRMLRSDDE